MNRKFLLTLFCILISLTFISAESTKSNFQLIGAGTDFGTLSDVTCQEGTDFIAQIAPFGCEPAIVRQDLIEEQNVPVFCQLAVTQLNPLIKVDAISSVSFSGELPKEVSGVGFQPAYSALGVKEKLGYPVLDNIGNAVIVLKQQKNSSALPDYVGGNLTARLKYDIGNAFGIGQSSFYLPVLTDEEWEYNYKQYAFWKGKGYLRATDLDSEGASIEVYRDVNNRLTSFDLEKGVSKKFYLPGFECLAGLNIKVDSLQNPDTSVVLGLNEGYAEVVAKEKFLDNKCQVISIKNRGLNQEVALRCTTDNKKSDSFTLKVSPEIDLEIKGKISNPKKITPESVCGEVEINPIEKKGSYSTGDLLYDFYETTDILATSTKYCKHYYVYIGYIGKTQGADPAYFIIPVVSEQPTSQLFLNSLGDNLAANYGERIRFNEDGTVKADAIKWFVNLISSLDDRGAVGNPIVLGKNTKVVFWGKNSYPEQDVSILFSAFSGAQDKWEQDVVENPDSFSLTNDEKEVIANLTSAKKDFEEIMFSFGTEIYSGKITYGEQAMFNLIKLNSDVGQKKTAGELCKNFEDKYPQSSLLSQLSSSCSEQSLSSNSLNSHEIYINGEQIRMSIEEINQPSLEDFSAEVFYTSPVTGVSETIILTKNAVTPLKNSKNEWIKLESLDDDSAKVVISYISGELSSPDKNKPATIEPVYAGMGKGISASFNLGEVEGDKGINKYSFKLVKINLKKVAKVSLTPTLDNSGTEIKFPFKIGIEKRAIELSPEKTKEKIKNLNETLAKWTDRSEKLGTAVQGLKTACLATGAVLTITNLISNLDGRGIARTKAMGGYWNDYCANWQANSNDNPSGYSSEEDCFFKNNANIEKSVDEYEKTIQAQNAQAKVNSEGAVVSSSILDGTVVDTTKVMQKITGQQLVSPGFTLPNPSDKNKPAITSEQISGLFSMNNWQKGAYSQEELREVQLNLKLLESNQLSAKEKEALQQKTYNQLENINKAVEGFKETEKANQELKNLNINGMEIRNYVSKNRVTGIYDGLKLTCSNIESLPCCATTAAAESCNNKPYQVLTVNGNKYLFILSLNSAGQYGVEKVYKVTSISSEKIIVGEEVTGKNAESLNIFGSFQKFDSTSYTNKFSSKQNLRCYETEPYKGLPGFVPFNENEGWYAVVKQQTSALGKIASYDKSGRVNSLWVCNVGKNGRPEFQENVGDDICEQVNLGTGQSYSSFPGLDESQSKKIIENAVKAVELASKACVSGQKGYTSPSGTYFGTGTPMVDSTEVKCTDFASPNECRILFNVCDPVVCPSSRCDFAGAFPVKDVIQSGIVGSIALCLPNIREGIIVPVCLSGIKAGIDGYLSVVQSYSDCLQESLTTGQVVGICDEIYSINLCEFFWRQAIPLAEIAIPALLEIATGQNTHGGGEYMNVQEAWTTAGKSVSYFTDYYAANSFKAFKARNSEEVGTEVCKNSVSGVYPNGDLLNSLTAPDSPPQFHAKFDEIPYTTNTNPPISQYKVYYHIYAGKDSRAYFKVYLKSSSTSTFYQDSSGIRYVNSGYIAKGGYASETKDFTAPAGFKELCINVNGQEECGFKEVSTSFAVDYITDTYLSDQSKVQATTESECVSGTASIYNAVDLNAQSAAQNAINPQIYNRGIIRICATDNPGNGNDAKANVQGSRWIQVGTCGNDKLKCWLDTNSVKGAIEFQSIANQTITDAAAAAKTDLTKQGLLFDDDKVKAEIAVITGITDPVSKLQSINDLLSKTYMNSDKAKLLLERGNIYADWARKIAIKLGILKESAVEVKPVTETGTGAAGSETVTPTPTGTDETTPSESYKITGRPILEQNGASLFLTLDANCFDLKIKLYKENKAFDNGGFFKFLDLNGFDTLTQEMTKEKLMELKVSGSNDKYLFTGLSLEDVKYYFNFICLDNKQKEVSNVDSTIILWKSPEITAIPLLK